MTSPPLTLQCWKACSNEKTAQLQLFTVQKTKSLKLACTNLFLLGGYIQRPQWWTDSDFTGEGGREHDSLSLANWRDAPTLNHFPDLGLKSHVQHPVSFIQNHIPTQNNHNTCGLPNCAQKAYIRVQTFLCISVAYI